MRYNDDGPDCDCTQLQRHRKLNPVRADSHFDDCPRAAWNDAMRTAKRTHGPCTCHEDDVPGHEPDCPSLYPAQQEPDALTRLVRHVRNRMGANSVLWEEEALSLISEAREEQRKAVLRAKDDGLEKAAEYFDREADKAGEYAGRGRTEREREGWADRSLAKRYDASQIRALKDAKP